MAFPFSIDITADETETIIPREYGINFETGKLTGEIVEGVEAIKVWIYLALNTERYKYVIYSWDFGNELESLIGTSFAVDYIETECKRLVEDCLYMNSNIIDLTNFAVDILDDKLNISFTVNTLFGEGDINV